MKILQTSTFVKQVKKLQVNQKKQLDQAIIMIANNPYIGEIKKGDLRGVYVYKFKMVNQLMLLAYECNDEKEPTLLLLALGSHENFYRDLKR